MKIHLYTNNAQDTVALINDDEKVISFWAAESKGGVQKTALEDALFTTDPNEWDDQLLEVALDEFEEGNELYLVIHENGSWETEDRELLESRLSFQLGEDHPIVKALNI